ncbi:MAG: HD domain-containing protein [Flavobacteriales bacterium]|nr:HD domain-containing protein [Flavobacteriales bacterium]
MDVLEAASAIGRDEGLSDHEWTLLKTAILLHDSGFMEGYQEHEERSCEIASQILPNYGYTEKDIEIIHGMIRATKIPQQPTNILENIIADADLEYLGTDRFDDISETLFQEWQNKDIIHSREDWDKAQIAFISKHRYFTDFCKAHREQAKWDNLDRVKQRVEDMA